MDKEEVLYAFRIIGLCGLAVIFLFSIIAIPVTILDWVSSCKQSEIYNKLHQKAYTCSDFFWAGEQINTQTQTIKLLK